MKKSTFPSPAPRRDNEQSGPRHDAFPAHKKLEDKDPAAAPRQNDPGRPERSGDPRPRKTPAFRRDHAKAQPAFSRTPQHRAPEESQRSDDLSLLPGIKPVTELLQADPAKIDTVFLRKGRKGKDTDAIIDLCRKNNVRFSLSDDTFFEKLLPGRHQGVIARLFASGFTDLDDLLESALESPLPLLVALDQVQDPGNAGAIARTLYALGGAGLVLPRHNGVYLGAAAARVAAGALEKLPVAKPVNLAQALDAAKDAGFAIYGAHSGTLSPEDTTPVINAFALAASLPAILVLGSEDSGLRPGIAKRCDAFIKIPFARVFDSLNVAQAGAIIVAAFAAARRG